MANTYDARNITVLEGLDAVRLRPGMYIGSTDNRGMHHLLWEIVDNAVDEAANGYATSVQVTLRSDGAATVEDDGRGIPVDIHPEHGVPGVELIFTRLHAGGKFDDSNYAYSGGLHGVGASVVNALSTYVVVESAVGGDLYTQRFTSEYNLESGRVEAGKPDGPLQKVGKTRRKGSRVTFLPDATIFADTRFRFEMIERRLRELAFLNKGIRFVLKDERKGEKREKIFCFSGGIVGFVKYLNEEKSPLFDPPIEIEGVSGGIHVALSIQYNDGYNETVVSYVNNIPTSEGGMHEAGFRSALTRLMNDYLRRTGQLKEKDANFSGEDFREGLCAVLSLKMTNVQFEGQTKGKLGNPEARTAVEAVVLEALGAYMEDLRNAQTVAKMAEKAVQAAKVRAAARKAKRMARERSKLDGVPLIGKLASCSSRKPLQNELFIVEGDSAGGSAKQGRDRKFQAILPLRGKPLNAEKKRLDQVLANEEFRTIVAALGCGIDEDFDLTSLRYNRVIILADADQDGAHIRAILLTFFFRYMRPLVNDGHLFIGQPPLYRIATRGGKARYAYDDRQLAAYTKNLKNYTVQRYKGLGEMNPSQLWETTMDPDNRLLVQVTIEDAAEADRRISVLMGDKVERRKAYITEYANFNKTDEFQAMEAKRNGN